MVRKAAEIAFISRPNQQLEGSFEKLALNAEGFSARRNEIAHGIVYQIDQISFFRELLDNGTQHLRHFALIPPYYLGRKHNQGLPAYAYTLKSMLTIEQRLSLLVINLMDFRDTYVARC